MTNLELQKKANEIRKGIVTAVHSAKSGHPGGSLSAADIFTYLYFEEMNIDPENPRKADRDRFVLSKGHTAPGYYSALANRGFFPGEVIATAREEITKAITDDRLMGLSIATRPDCLSDEVILLLKRLNEIKPITIELGLQTVNETTAIYINRGYSLLVYDDACQRLLSIWCTFLWRVDRFGFDEP